MRNIFVIAGRETRSAFVTPLAYVVITSFIVLSGYFFFGLIEMFNAGLKQALLMPDAQINLNEWVVMPYLRTLQLVLVFLVPVLTMRSFAEERQTGTFELLLTSPLSSLQLLLGKFLGVSVVVVVMLALSFVFPLLLAIFADPEVPPIFMGFLGIVLLALSFVTLGIAVSCFTRSQTVACVVGIVLLLLLYLADIPANNVREPLSSILSYLSPAFHTEQFLKGVFDAGDLVYFASLIFIGFFMATRALEIERWR